MCLAGLQVSRDFSSCILQVHHPSPHCLLGEPECFLRRTHL